MIEWWAPKFGRDEIENLKKVIQSGYINEGPLTLELESKFKSFLGVKHAIFCTSGTSSIFLALKAFNIGSGDYVAVPNITFIATANAISLTGATPVLIDVHRDTLGLNMEDLIEKNKIFKFKAVIPVHVSGRSSLVGLNLEFLKSHQIKIIEDAAEAFSSKNPLTGKYLGTETDAGAFSFSPNKIITSGQGGLVVTNDENVADSIRRLKDQGRNVRGTGGNDLHPIIGYNFKFTDLQAAILEAQFEQLAHRKTHLINVYKMYLENIKLDDKSYLLKFDVQNEEFPLWPEFRSSDINKLEKAMKENQINFRKFWFPLNTQAAYKNDSKYRTGTDDLIWLPSSFDLDESKIEKITNILNSTIKSSNKS